MSRTLAKVNYHIHTDAVKKRLIPVNLAENKDKFVYAGEADLLNLALFGVTAKEWRDRNPDSPGNIRDEATIEQLVVLSNLESLNSELIKLKVSAEERLSRLNAIAIEQMKILLRHRTLKKLE